MNLCPKCGELINTTEDKCPKCNTLLVKDNVEILDLELPITKEEKEIKLKEIPLEVKKVKNNKEQKEKITSIFIFNILFIIILIITSLFLITTIYTELNKTEKEEINYVYKNNGLYSDFISTNEELLSLNEDGTFTLYDNYKIFEDNYYKGIYEYKISDEALKEMGYTKEEFLQEFPNVDLNNVYSIYLKPLTAYFSGKDTTEKDISSKDKWWFLLIIENDSNIYGYNKTLDIRYNFIRK